MHKQQSEIVDDCLYIIDKQIQLENSTEAKQCAASLPLATCYVG